MDSEKGLYSPGLPKCPEISGRIQNLLGEGRGADADSNVLKGHMDITTSRPACS